jgi:hypothetical protein
MIVGEKVVASESFVEELQILLHGSKIVAQVKISRRLYPGQDYRLCLA